MKMIFKKMRVGLVLVGVAMLAGCSLGVNESTSYSIPNWTADGRIIARKVYLKTEHTLVSNSEIRAYQNSIVVMDDNGGHEQKLFDVDENGISLVEMSPSGNYVGYINSMSLLKVFKNEGGRWNLKWTKTVDRFTDRISFSLDETKLMLNIGYSRLFVYSTNSPDHLIYSNNDRQGAPGLWLSGTQFYFADNNIEKLVVVDTISSQERPLSFVMFPEIYVASENALYYQSSSFDAGAFRVRCRLDTGETTTTNFTYTPYKYEDFVGRHLSPDGKKIVMSYGGSIDPAGIFLLDINNSNLSRIK